MESIKIFRKRNRISQVALAEYLQVTQGFISQMENGTSAIPDSVISNLLANPYNWDVSMLDTKSRDSKPELVAELKPQLSNVEILLRDLLAERDNEIKVLNEIIWELKEEIGSLKNQLKHKGGTAPSADGSFVANVG